MQRHGARVRAQLATGLAPLVDLVFPPRCPGCGLALAAQDGLCVTCWDQLERPDVDPADGVVAATLYGPVSRKLVLAFKHGGRIALAPMLARMIVARLPALPGAWLVVPVPLHRGRLWRRGYNQGRCWRARSRAQPGTGCWWMRCIVAAALPPAWADWAGSSVPWRWTAPSCALRAMRRR